MPIGGHDWLALTPEPTLEPALPICDSHHHLWEFRPEPVHFIENATTDRSQPSSSRQLRDTTEVRSIPSDLALYGLDYRHMDGVRDQGRECLDVVLKIWAAKDGTFDYDGKYSQVHAPEMHRHLGRRLWIQPYQKPAPASWGRQYQLGVGYHPASGGTGVVALE